jgi:2'-5' RNA ligase
MNLFGSDTPPPPKPSDLPKEHQFFYAVKPTDEATARLMDTRGSLSKRFGLGGKGVAGTRLHITLRPLPHYHVYPDHRIELFCRIGSTIRQKPFLVTVDLARSYASLVLVPSVPNEQLAELEQALSSTLAEAGFSAQWSFSPHVTLLYSDKKIPDKKVDPISWTVNEFVLIHSVHGKTIHNIIERFPLRG